MKAALLENPYITLCTPPVLMVLQFITAVSLFDHGLPYWSSKDTLHSGLLLTAFFGLCLPAIPAILLGIRHILYGSNKVAPALGVAFNILYILGFGLFFVMVFLTQSLT
ncbi:MAG: hypothetical protein JWP91_4552 [Fibrobacteres bacterium]|nr:hypothetical protein [Fibrobacterota bacterium]